MEEVAGCCCTAARTAAEGSKWVLERFVRYCRAGMVQEAEWGTVVLLVCKVGEVGLPSVVAQLTVAVVVAGSCIRWWRQMLGW